jgi:hypothetical protein
VDRAREELLAGAALAQEHDRRVGGRDAPRLADRHLEQRAVAQEPRVILVDGCSAARHVDGARATLQRALHQLHEAVRVERLRDEVVRAGLHRLHRNLERAVRGDDEHRQERVLGDPFAQELQARTVRELEVREHYLRTRRRRECRASLGHVRARGDLEAATLQRLGQHHARRLAILHHHGTLQGRSSTGRRITNSVPTFSRLCSCTRPP